MGPELDEDPDDVPTDGFRIEDLEGPMAQVLLAELARLDALDAERPPNTPSPPPTALDMPRPLPPEGLAMLDASLEELTLDDTPADRTDSAGLPWLFFAAGAAVAGLIALVGWLAF